MRKSEFILDVEAQRELLEIKLDAGLLSKDEFDKEILHLKPKVVGCLVG